MVFALARTFKKPASGDNAQRGFPSPGDGAQTTGDYEPQPSDVAWSSAYPTKGRRTFWDAFRPSGGQQGFPDPTGAGQERPRGSMPNNPPFSGLPSWAPVAKQSYGAAGVAPQYGKVLTNPIGAGVVALDRPQASYGGAAQYVNGAIWWTSQAIPTTVNLQGLTSPEQLAALLGDTYVQAVVRVEG